MFDKKSNFSLNLVQYLLTILYCVWVCGNHIFLEELKEKALAKIKTMQPNLLIVISGKGCGYVLNAIVKTASMMYF